jgi:hypothetical protein
VITAILKFEAAETDKLTPEIRATYAMMQIGHFGMNTSTAPDTNQPANNRSWRPKLIRPAAQQCGLSDNICESSYVASPPVRADAWPASIPPCTFSAHC